MLAHVLFPNPGEFIKEIGAQAAPKSVASMLSPDTLKLFASSAGIDNALVSPLAFDKPMGCALVDIPAKDYATACFFGYEGGTATLMAAAKGIEELDGMGHAAHLRVSGEHVFLDDLGDYIVVTNHEDVLSSCQGYIQSNLIDRADKTVSDIELVGYVSGLVKRYESDLQPILDEIGQEPFGAAGNPLETAMAEYLAASNKKTVQRVKDMKQMTLGLGLEPSGFVMRWAVFPEEGTAFETELRAASAGPVDAGLVGSLPDTTWSAAAVRFDSNVTEAELVTKLKDTVVDEYAKEIGKDPADVRASLDAFLADAKSIYKSEFALGLLHEPGTLGGAVLSVPLEGGSGEESWQEWADVFTPKAVFGESGAKKISWTFSESTTKVSGKPAKRWQISPTADAIAEFERESPDSLAAVRKKWPDLTMTIDRVELDGRALFILTPTNAEKYLDAAVKAAGGTKSLASDPGYKKIIDRSPRFSLLWALDVASMLDWFRDVAPPSETADIPRGVGNDLSDFAVVGTYGASGTQSGEMVLSQPLLDDLRALAD